MYVDQQYIAKDKHRELIKQAEASQQRRQAAQANKLEKQRERAERQLVKAWRRVEQLRESMALG